MSLGKNKILAQSAAGGLVNTENFAPVLYTGNGSTQSISTVGFQPDLVWIKPRSIADNHNLFDSIRGATKQLVSNSMTAESTQANTLTSFDSNGFTTGPDNNTNTNNATHVAWCFKGGGAAVSNTNGTISSQVSANVDSGFSIVKYTGNGTQGADFGHGLSTAPEMVIFKRLEAPVNHWFVYHKDLTAGHYITLDQSNAEADFALFNDDVPDSTTFPLSNNAGVNSNAIGYIAYCWTSITGYSSIGTYTGNNTTNVVTTGFQPRFVMVKASSHTSSWYIVDSTRTDDKFLSPNLTAIEYTDAGKINFTSIDDGAKIEIILNK